MKVQLSSSSASVGGTPLHCLCSTSSLACLRHTDHSTTQLSVSWPAGQH